MDELFLKVFCKGNAAHNCRLIADDLSDLLDFYRTNTSSLIETGTCKKKFPNEMIQRHLVKNLYHKKEVRGFSSSKYRAQFFNFRIKYIQELLNLLDSRKPKALADFWLLKDVLCEFYPNKSKKFNLNKIAFLLRKESKFGCYNFKDFHLNPKRKIYGGISDLFYFQIQVAHYFNFLNDYDDARRYYRRGFSYITRKLWKDSIPKQPEEGVTLVDGKEFKKFDFSDLKVEVIDLEESDDLPKYKFTVYYKEHRYKNDSFTLKKSLLVSRWISKFFDQIQNGETSDFTVEIKNTSERKIYDNFDQL